MKKTSFGSGITRSDFIKGATSAALAAGTAGKAVAEVAATETKPSLI
jgi:hypothetical protein